MSTQLANAAKPKEQKAQEAKIDQAPRGSQDELAAPEVDFYEQAFHRLKADKEMPAWVNELRQRSMSAFIYQSGFPTPREEDYKYTNVKLIAEGNFKPATLNFETSKVAFFADFNYEETKQSRLVFINGIFNAELSNTEGLLGEVVALDMKEALKGAHADLIRGYFSRAAENSPDDAFTNLNNAFLTSGAFLYIPKNVEIETPIHFAFLTDASEKVATFPRALVIAESFSRATIIEEHKAANENGEAYFSNALVEIFVDDEAHLTHYKLNSEAENAFHLARTRTEVGRASNYNSTTINLGAAFTRHNINMSLRGEGSESWIDGLFFGENTQFCDTHSLINHRQPHCTSHQSYKGILNDKARSVFNGRIYVHEGAQKTDAYQSNKNLILSDQARVDTKPQLEIFADDVKCSHGATVGQLNEEELFYLTSRGLQPELARNLLTYGFAEQVVQKIEVESIKRQVDAAILNRLHTTLE